MGQTVKLPLNQEETAKAKIEYGSERDVSNYLYDLNDVETFNGGRFS